MSRKQPSKTEHVVLEAYYQSEARGAGALKPTNIELGRKLEVTPDAIAHAKRRLKNRRYLSESDEVTSDGLQYLRHEVEVIPTEIPLVGEVRAGQARDGDLVVNMVHRSEFLDPDREHLSIPSNENPSGTIALRVRGKSMEDHNIFDGDYVFVEVYENGVMPPDGELIVTYYLPSSFHDLSAEISVDDIDENEFDGPTIKYFYRKEDTFRLSPRVNADDHWSTIRTRGIRPVGKVVGSYRPM